MPPGDAISPAVAVIVEETCIGCTLCVEACPMDAIVGAARHLHTVIASECIGCRLCLPPCPVDCIQMIPAGKPLTREQSRQRAALARLRHTSRIARLGREHLERLERNPGKTAEQKKRAAIERAMQRARQRLRER